MAGRLIGVNNSIICKDNKILCKPPLTTVIARKTYEYIKIGNRLWMVDLLKWSPSNSDDVMYGHIVDHNLVIDTTPDDNIDIYYYATQAGGAFNSKTLRAELESACDGWRVPTLTDIKELMEACNCIPYQEYYPFSWEMRIVPFNLYNTGFYSAGGYSGTGLKDYDMQLMFIIGNYYELYKNIEACKYIIGEGSYNPRSGLFYIPLRLCKDI